MICSTAFMAACALSHNGTMNVLGEDINLWAGLSAVAVGAYLPDIDIAQSRLGQKFSYISEHTKHRGITHTLVVPLVLLSSMPFLSYTKVSIVACLLLGWLADLLFDKRIPKRKRKGSWWGEFIRCKPAIIVTLLSLSFAVPTGHTPSLLFGVFAGWVLHIVEDLFNKKGCPLLWPVFKGHIHIMSFKTRHWTEYAFMFLWLGGCGIWAYLTLAGA